MKRILAIVLLACAALLGAEQSRFYHLRDKKGDLAIEQMTSYVSEFSPGGDVSFRGSGKPVTGLSRKQGVGFKALSVAGLARKDAKGGLFLQQATLEGSVELSVSRNVTVDGKAEGEVVTTLSSAKVAFDEGTAEAVVQVPGSFTMRDEENRATGRERRLATMAGASATLKFVPLNQRTDRPLRSVVVQGPVRFHYELERDERRTVDGQPKTVRGVTKLNVRGARLTFDAASRKLTLTGNVAYDVDSSTGYEGEGVGDSVVITFNEKNQVSNVRVEGSPGTSTVKEGSSAR